MMDTGQDPRKDICFLSGINNQFKAVCGLAHCGTKHSVFCQLNVHVYNDLSGDFLNDLETSQ